MSHNKNSPSNGLSGVVNRLNTNKTPSPIIKDEPPGTAQTVLDTDSIATQLNSPENDNNGQLHDQIFNLQNENKILRTQIININNNYKDIPVPDTVIADRSGNSLYTICPFNTHPENTEIFNNENKRVILKPMLVNFLKSLYIRCPLTTAHPDNAPRFNQDNQPIVGSKLFSSPNYKTHKSSNKSRKRKLSPNKSPSPSKSYSPTRKRNKP
jgi:hypothetical protein